MRLPVSHALPLVALVMIGAGAAGAKERQQVLPAPSGPAADYPVVVGDPFQIGGTVWTPVDQLNYDAVGQAVAGVAPGTGVSGAHKTLPLPSYVEVTSLDSGKTILVRIERRGPMDNGLLIELSPDAAGQLGLDPGRNAPVRVRRVNPPEPERAMLRSGGRAPERMETPEGLLKVLRRKLVDQAPLAPVVRPVPALALPASGVAMPYSAMPNTAKAPPPPVAAPVAVTPAPPAAAPAAVPATDATAPAPKGALVVQVAAFSVEASARRLAADLGGKVTRGGKYWRVRMGPFANRAQAAPALEKARRAGYSDARIQPAD